MKSPTAILAAIVLSSPYAYAHYTFGHLVVNGTYDQSKVWRYVREPANGLNAPIGMSASDLPATPPWEKGKPGAPLGAMPDLRNILAQTRAEPQTNNDVGTTNYRCGRDGWKPHNTTGTADVLAGEKVGFRPETFYTGISNFSPITYYDSITHIGPGLAYLAKKPDGIELSQWDGDGEWFKIDYTGPATNESWVLLGAKQYDVTIPKTTPPGEYLLRVEHIYPSTGNTSEFFVNCAQVNIIGRGGGTPTGFAKFPGAYKSNEPALSLPEGEEIVNGSDAAAVRWKHGFLSYIQPGPPVWTGR